MGITEHLQRSERWDDAWGRARDQLPEYPEDWIPATPDRTDTGQPGPATLAAEAIVSRMGQLLAAEADRRAKLAGAAPPVDFDIEIERLRDALYDLEDEISDSWAELEEEALDDLFPGVWPEELDADAQVALRRHTYQADPTRGPVSADLAAALDRRARLTAGLVEVLDGRAAAAAEWATVWRDEAFALLAECRAIGPGHSGFPFLLAQADKRPANAVATAAEYLPRDWITRIVEAGPVSILPASVGYWHPEDRVAGIPGGTNVTIDDPTLAGAVYVTFTMAAAHIPHLRRLQWAFVERRTVRRSKFGDHTTHQRRTLHPISEGNPLDPSGRTWRNGNFASPYIGITTDDPQPDDPYEALAVGAQGLVAGHPYLWRPGDDHLFWLLGVLSAA